MSGHGGAPLAGSRGRRGPGAGRWILAGLLLLPVVEIAVAVVVARRVGAGQTIAALAVLSLVGVVVLRRSGRAAWRSLGPQVVQGGAAPPTTPASKARGADLALELAGAVLLVVPGFVTAVAGALLVVPPTRRVVRPLLGVGAGRLVAAAIRRQPGRVVAGEAADVQAADVKVVDVEVVDVKVVDVAEADRGTADAGPGRRPAVTADVDEPRDDPRA
jgi:UPF0716 protein FxsA